MCKFLITREGRCRMLLAEQLAAIGSDQRLRILAALQPGSVHVSELARRLEMSRPLLYMHLTKLESAGFVRSELVLSPEGKALKRFELVPFDLHITPDLITDAVEHDDGT